MKMNNGPIPGENFTSDTRNYPWHRPPDIVDFDEAVEYAVKGMMKPKPASGILTMLEMGMSVAMLTTNIVMAGVGRGKWTVNLALLISGPIARAMEMMADQAGIKYTMGIAEDETPIVPPPEFMQQMDEPKTSTNVSSIDEEQILKAVTKSGFKKPKEAK